MRFSFSAPARLIAGQLLETGSANNISMQADAARNRGDWAEAADCYNRAIAADPARTGLLVQLGHSEKELGNYDRAETAYRKYLGLNPGNADIHLQLGHLFNRIGDSKTALLWYEKAQTLAPDNQDIVRHLNTARNRSGKPGAEQKRREAMSLVEKQEWQQARGLLRELVVEDNERDLIAVYANVTKEDGDFDEAQILYERYRDYANAYDQNSLEDVELQLGHLHKIAGQYNLALSHYILARNHQFTRSGYVDRTAPIQGEIQTCINEIYTCFADLA